MYGFRKPFTVAKFYGSVEVFGLPPMDYKILLIVSQLLGYCLSKWIGIKVISEMGRNGRAKAILLCIAVAEGALLMFAITPRPWSAVWLFVNGLPLGMVWGLVFGYLEGRRVSEALGAGLSASYIVASGVVKSIGAFFMDIHGPFAVREEWMPFVTGLVFLVPIVFFVFLLSCLPPPTAEDEASRVKRVPMDGKARVAFLKRYGVGLFFLTLLYMFLTAYRDFRDSFAAEIWAALGYGGEPAIFAQAELPIAAVVLLTLAAVAKIQSNRHALLFVHAIMLAGSITIGVSTWAYEAGILSGPAWMILVGIGMYVGYVPYGCVLFDRLIAAVGVMATAGFMIYVTDAAGYLGSVGNYFYKTFGQADLSWLEFFIAFSYVTSIVCSVCFLLSMIYFARVTRRAEAFR